MVRDHWLQQVAVWWDILEMDLRLDSHSIGAGGALLTCCPPPRRLRLTSLQLQMSIGDNFSGKKHPNVRLRHQIDTSSLTGKKS
jgi:hypothetical protein